VVSRPRWGVLAIAVALVFLTAAAIAIAHVLSSPDELATRSIACYAKADLSSDVTVVANDRAPVAAPLFSYGERALDSRIALQREGDTKTALMRRFGALEQRVDDGLRKAVELIGQTAAAYLDPDHGAVKTMLDELEKNLDDAFDPDSKASVIKARRPALGRHGGH
jgi:hypothetical protein